MEDRLEIIVTLRDDPNSPKKVRFEELYDIREQIASLVLLWNANSYYVDSVNNVFMLNGGRRLHMENLGECLILYRKRNSLTTSMTGQEQARSTSWVIGLQRVEDEDKIVALKIDDTGSTWQWVDSL